MAEIYSENDILYMKRAIELAKQGGRDTSPNPCVGCVIVRDGRIISEGWHHKYGSDHAEADAIKNASGNIEGSSVYVTLEPCSHYGKTPPCAKLLAELHPKEVIAGMGDPNPKVNGKGIEILREAGITVRMPLLEKECRRLNKGFLSRIERGRPWVTIKSGISLDGKIALNNGESKWITGESSRLEAQRLRAENDALLTGAGTVIADDPKLTVRDVPGRNPLRAVIDPSLRTPENAAIFEDGNVVFYADAAVPEDKIRSFEEKGAKVECIDFKSERPLANILSKMGENGINYLLVEAGARTVSAFLSEGLADELDLFVAPKLIGSGLGFTEGFEIASLGSAFRLKELSAEACGEDLRIKGVTECSLDWLKPLEK
ncbi:MAG: bifunctional diaminohydroxyphosphoribosylaminopyrimidine deaminase/5-amino-6-(5-phosphoribosylamino)uracil reductase RibD [Synergistaceae bacterium]|nr:bifunctional diaminohydroxyphosphoribosylaminopyrimidine deaminase/5-amino-6-(5-phosphoribosylamino)uracil reductase RibD [Synergistaceae bacterium]